MSNQLMRYLSEKISKGVKTFVNIVTLANRDLPYHDYLSDTTTSTKQSYAVGSENQKGRGDQNKLFTSKSTLLLSTTDCYVIFNSAENVVQTLLANTWYEFKSNIFMIHYYYVSVEGTLYAYFEGVHPSEARRPE